MDSTSIIKILVLGASGVGKTSLMNKYIYNEFRQQYKATLGTDFFSKPVTVKTPEGTDQGVELQIWDTVGTERFGGLGLAFYRGTHACCIVFDLTNAESFTDLDHCYDEFCIQADPASPETFPFFVVGNKADLVGHRVVTEEAARAWCAAKGDNVVYFECSAKDGQNVENVFLAAGEAGYVTASQAGDETDTAVEIPNFYDTDNSTKICKC